MKLRTSLLMSAALASAAPVVQAQDAGPWLLRVGVHAVVPKSNNSDIVDVGTGIGLTFNATYFFHPNWGIELLAALPFTHDIDLKSGGTVARVKHLPPTLSLQYHFNPNGRVQPYVGAGLNYTLFFNEETRGALQGAKLELDPSFGPAAQVGMDIDLGSNWYLNADARWFDIDTKATLNGASLGTVHIDPYAFGISAGRRF